MIKFPIQKGYFMFQAICQSENINPVPRIRHSSSSPALPHIKQRVIAHVMLLARIMVFAHVIFLTHVMVLAHAMF